MAVDELSSTTVQQALQQHGRDFEALLALLQRITPSFVASSAPTWVTDAIAQVARQLTASATIQSQWEKAVRAIFRCFQCILSDRDPSPAGRQRIVLVVANLLFKLYFRLNQVRMCETVARNIVASGANFNNYSRAERVGYRYYLGRYYLTQQQFRRSRSHLVWALQHCSVRHHGNRRLILAYLVTASLPIGIFPSADILRSCGLEALFGPLVQALVKGDYRGFHRHLRFHHEAFHLYGIYLYLASRCDMVLFRSLLRRTVLLTLTQGAVQKTPHIRLDVLRQAIQFATEDDIPWDVSDVEHLCVSLIDVGFIKGYIHHDRQLLVLDKKTMGFPPVAAARQVELPGNEDDQQFGAS
jgi:hypothetical protein